MPLTQRQSIPADSLNELLKLPQKPIQYSINAHMAFVNARPSPGPDDPGPDPEPEPDPNPRNEQVYFDGDVIKSTDGNIYVIQDAKQRLIQDESTLAAFLYDSPTLVEQGDENALKDYPVGNPFPRLALGDLVQSGGAEVFVLRKTGATWIPDPTTFNLLGYSWTNIKQLGSDASILPRGYALPSRMDRKIVRGNILGDIYVIGNGERHLVPDHDSFIAMRLDANAVGTFMKDDVDAIPEGVALPRIPLLASFPVSVGRGDDVTSGGHMYTTVTLNDTGRLDAVTHTFCTNWFVGFTGGVIAVLMNQDGKPMAASNMVSFGVDGAKIPFGTSDRRDNWSFTFDPNLIPLVRSVTILQEHDPHPRTPGWLDELTSDIITFFGSITSYIPVTVQAELAFEIFLQNAIGHAKHVEVPGEFKSDLYTYSELVNTDDGGILKSGAARAAQFYLGGPVPGGQEAITFNLSVFVRPSSWRPDVYIHETVHVHQYKIGIFNFLTLYGVESIGTFFMQCLLGLDIGVTNQNPLEDQAYAIEGRFSIWRASLPKTS